MVRRIVLVALGLLVVAAPLPAWAASDWTTAGSYGHQAMGKFTYGLENVALGWTSFFTTPYNAGQSGDNVVMGIGQGLWNGVGQTVGGALHLATFPLTMVDVPLPEGGVGLLK